MNLDKILLKHYKLYPKMQIQDMVKLFYQNEFGGGHLIKNKGDSLKRLEEEYHSLERCSLSHNQCHYQYSNDYMGEMSEKNRDGEVPEVPEVSQISQISQVSEVFEVFKVFEDSGLLPEFNELFVDIGNNLFRFDLRMLKNIMAKNADNIVSNKAGNKDYNNKYIDLATINSFFVNTANSVSGDLQSFEEKLEILKQCCKKGIFPYSVAEVEDYLVDYKAKGYPAVSHSEVYRSTYSPAYRIVEARYRDFFEVFCRIDTLLKSRDRIIVAIDGNSGSGKSTLAAFIADVYDDYNIFHMDDYFLTPELKTEERLSEIGGNVDYVRFKKEIIDGLNSGAQFQYRKYDCQQGVLQESVNVIPKKLNIIEGSYSMHPTLRESYDLKIFLHVDPEEQSRRILKRNGEKMHKIFINRWIPLENRYFMEMGIKEQSDLVFNM